MGKGGNDDKGGGYWVVSWNFLRKTTALKRETTLLSSLPTIFVQWVCETSEVYAMHNVGLFQKKTLPETNMAPETKASQKETNLSTINFQGLC